MSYERPYYKDIDYRPQLFYAAFGVGDTELEVSKVRHKVDGFPEGLSMTAYEKPEHAEYMEALIGGDLGEMLRDRTPQLYEAVCGTDKFTVIRGQVKDDGDLCYFRNVIGFIEAMVEEGALGILDVFTTTLFSPSEWTKNIFEPEFNPCTHVMIFTSEMEDGLIWLHTRGMIKFGRPDISMEGVSDNMTENAARIINQMIFYGAQGVFFSRPTKLHTHNGLTAIVKPQFIDDTENLDFFGNSYYRLMWNECEIEKE